MNRLIYIVFFVILVPTFAFSQSQRWKRTRYELYGGLGATNFLGELGGSDNVGGDYLADFEFSSSRPLMVLGIRYKVLEPLAVKGALSFGYLSGSDASTGNIYRKNRNLSFRSPIVELGFQTEYSIIKERISSYRRSRRSRHRGFSLSRLSLNTYIFTGINVFWFNPQAKGLDGKWYNLQPIGTEGQGKVATRDKYHRVQFSIPIGFGFKYPITRKISVGVEYGGRLTFTDYIDDVSTTYVDPDYFTNPNDKYLANPCIDEQVLGPQDIRGNPKYNDYYMFMVFNISYKLRTGRNGMPKF